MSLSVKQPFFLSAGLAKGRTVRLAVAPLSTTRSEQIRDNGFGEYFTEGLIGALRTGATQVKLLERTIGRPAIPLLKAAMGGAETSVQIRIVETIAIMGAEGKAEIPYLKALLGSTTDNYLKDAIEDALEKLAN